MLHRLEFIINISSDMQALLNRDFVYLVANTAYSAAFNMAPDSLIGKSVTEVFGGEFFNDVIRPRAERCLNGEDINYQAWFDFIDSAPKFMDIHYHPYKNESDKIVGFVVNGRNITKQKQAETELRNSEHKFRDLFENSPDPGWIIDKDNLFNLCNAAAARALGYSSIEELASVHPSELSPEFQPDRRKSFEKANEMMAIAHNKGIHRFEWSHRRKNGECFPVEVTLSRLGGSSDELRLYCIWRDVSESKKQAEALHELNEKLESLSLHDGLTCIANRRMFDTRINQEWGRCIREQQPLSLIMIDIDYFKQYNDYYGHQPGDECLKEVAQKLAELAKRTIDLCARYGGEEFVLLLPNTSLVEATHLAEKCRENIFQLNIPHETSSICDVVTISVGVSSITPIKGTISSSLIEDADKALYFAKENGRNMVKTCC